MTWCEHCRDHYDEDHYPDGSHAVGIKFGPTGRTLVAERILERLLASESVDVGRSDLLCVDGSIELDEREQEFVEDFYARLALR